MMMKRALIIFTPLLALLLTACPNGSTLYPVKKFMGLKGSPETLREHRMNVGEEYGEAIVYTFDKSGHIVELVSYDTNGKVNYIRSTEYDKHGAVAANMRSPYGDEMVFESLKKRKPGYELWESKRLSGGSSTIESVNTGSLCTVTVKYGDKVYSTEEYHLDDSGNVVEEKVVRDGRLITWNRSEYDAQGNRTQTQDLKDTDQPLTTYVYEGYDAEGNWTKCTMLVGGVPTTIILHEIGYTAPSAVGDEE